jgi:ferredoxin
VSTDPAVLRVSVDTDKCIAAGLCVTRIPSVFDQSDDDGLVRLLRTEVSADDERSAVLEAVSICPSGAITID